MPTLDQQLSAVFNAWLPFIFAVGAAAVVIWQVMEWRYKAVKEKTAELYDLMNKKTDLAAEEATKTEAALKSTIDEQTKQIELLKAQQDLSEETKAAVAGLERTSSRANNQLRRLSAANNAVSQAVSDTRRIMVPWHTISRLPLQTTCPICGAQAEQWPTPGDFDRFHCPTHDEFEVSGTAMGARRGRASPALWERALDSAKRRAKRGELPQIMNDDFL
jgi:hypothetical protein